MKKYLLLVVLILLAVTIDTGSGITGFLIQTASAMITITRAVIKEVLTLIIKVL